MSRPNQQSGFSLLEILVVVAILSIVLAVIFLAVNGVQKRNFTEQEQVDVTQNAREFVDQLARDMHNAGYPNSRMYASPPGTSSTLQAWPGLVAASATDVVFEGDLDGTGQITTVRYTLQNTSGKCPCTLQRSAAYRTTGDATSQTWQYTAEVQNVVNSIGGSSPWSISGTMPGGTSNDTYYAQYKELPLFQYYDKNGGLVSVPNDLSGGFNTSTASTIKTVVVTLNVLAPYPDKDTGVRPAATMRATVTVPNVF